jgi:anti-sigma factor RsiW
MLCDSWMEQLDAYLDGELPAAEARALDEHLRGCPACAGQSLSRVQFKRATHYAGQRYTPEPAFRARIEKQIAPPLLFSRNRFLIAVLIGSMALIAVFVFALIIGRQPDQRLLNELADLHVATLASTNPVDVISTDRHTVKPWFAGKIPFTFNLPELQNTGFTLVGGKVSYLRQSPGALLVFRVRQHEISVFIFQERDLGNVPKGNSRVQSFNERTWTENGLVYLAISDVNAQDLDTLCALIRAAD